MSVSAEEKRRPVLGIAGHDIAPGDTIIVDLTKGPNQLIWKDDGKEIEVGAQSRTLYIEDGNGKCRRKT